VTDSAHAHASEVLEWLKQGVALRAQGQHEAALGAYQKAVALPGAPAEAFFNLGNVLLDLGRWEESAAALERALQLQPQMAAALMQLARCEVRLGRLKAADAHFSELLQIDPQNFSAWLEHGNLHRQLGQADKMLAAYQQAASCTPQRWEGLLALTRSLEEAGRWELAAVNYQRAVALAGEAAGPAAKAERSKPTAPHSRVRQVHWHMARYRLERGDAARALEAMRQALMAARIEHPRHPLGVDERAEMQIDLGDIQMRLGMTAEAHRAFERASGAASEATLVRLAELSFRYNLWQEAQAVLKRNVALHPQSATALWNLAHSCAESWQMEEALEHLARAEAIAPQPGALSMRASVAGRTGDVETALRLYKELAEAEGPLSKMRSSAAMSALYSDQLSAQEVAALHRELFAPLGAGGRSVESFANPRQPHKRLRVGLVSADFHHQHPVNIFMQPVLARLDQAQFELTVYFTGVSHDDQTQQARSRVAHWVECTHWTDAQMARRIEGDGIDILVDLAGHTSLQRMSMFAQRAAPVQLTFLGYPGSTGVPSMDWILADPVVAPEGSDGLYSERVWRLPHTVFCFAPEVNYPYPKYTQAHAQRTLTFGSFNNVPKITQHTVALWSRVLQAVPQSQLLLKAPSFKDEGAIRAFKARFAAHGIDPSRLVFRGPVGLADMMAEYADVDIALDPVPYNGGTTTLQALWMGVPVVVKAGSNFVSRMGASFMAAADLPEWVAADDDAYVAIAQHMAADRVALLQLKQGLRSRLQSRPAWNIDQYTRDVEAALRSMWVALCEGEASPSP
jgi:predicted O-linked N-acetylglucosamine transferase (SPINDLY family)